MTVAAVWLGTSVFGLFVMPVFFSVEMKRLFPPPYNGAIAQLVLERYFVVHIICGLLALAHLGADWMYSGKVVSRVTLWLAGSVLAISLLGGYWLQPKLEKLQKIKYADQYRVAATPLEREAAGKAFGMWHGVSRTLDLFALFALWIYLVRIVNPGEPQRFVSPINKFGMDKIN